MQTGILEIVGFFLILVGVVGLVAAASMVSVALAVLTAAAFVLLAGVIAVYVAAQLDAKKAPAPKAQP